MERSHSQWMMSQRNAGSQNPPSQPTPAPHKPVLNSNSAAFGQHRTEENQVCIRQVKKFLAQHDPEYAKQIDLKHIMGNAGRMDFITLLTKMLKIFNPTYAFSTDEDLVEQINVLYDNRFSKFPLVKGKLSPGPGTSNSTLIHIIAEMSRDAEDILSGSSTDDRLGKLIECHKRLTQDGVTVAEQMARGLAEHERLQHEFAQLTSRVHEINNSDLLQREQEVAQNLANEERQIMSRANEYKTHSEEFERGVDQLMRRKEQIDSEVVSVEAASVTLVQDITEQQYGIAQQGRQKFEEAKLKLQRAKEDAIRLEDQNRRAGALLQQAEAELQMKFEDYNALVVKTIPSKHMKGQDLRVFDGNESVVSAAQVRFKDLISYYKNKRNAFETSCEELRWQKETCARRRDQKFAEVNEARTKQQQSAALLQRGSMLDAEYKRKVAELDEQRAALAQEEREVCRAISMAVTKLASQRAAIDRLQEQTDQFTIQLSSQALTVRGDTEFLKPRPDVHNRIA